MKVEHLDLRELLELDPHGGPARFAGERAVLLDTVAVGLLRKGLVESLGLAGAAESLQRLGYAHGWRNADSLRHEIPWETEADWRRSGGRLHAMQGLVASEPMPSPPTPEPLAHALWRDSWEAEQHLLHFGPAAAPACWTLTGFASGYLSRVQGREITCREVQCAAMGHPSCAVVGRPREEWEALGILAPPGEPDGAALRRALAPLSAALRRVPRPRRPPPAPEPAPSGLVSASEAMQRTVDLARRVARSGATALVTGESGVGKERISRLLHDASARAERPFVALNCAAIAEGLVESELFGHARGAFTGAAHDRPGLFEAADGGTLFLDEVGELPLSLQPKLLRALETREVRRVGENQARPVDVRLVAATNRDLGRLAVGGRFRLDLLYRLKVVEIPVPPLRDRPEDVLPLARAGLLAAAGRLGRGSLALSPRAADRLLRHGWPGNVRELLHAMERAAVTAEGGRVEVEDLPDEVRAGEGAGGDGPRPRSLAWLEREAVLAALRRSGGNRRLAARELGVGEATLYRKLKAWRVR